MKTLIIDGTRLTNVDEFHEYIARLLEAPAYYGKNLGALNDILTGWIETPVEIVWTAFAESKLHMGAEAEMARSVFDSAANERIGIHFRVLA